MSVTRHSWITGLLERNDAGQWTITDDQGTELLTDWLKRGKDKPVHIHFRILEDLGEHIPAIEFPEKPITNSGDQPVQEATTT